MSKNKLLIPVMAFTLIIIALIIVLNPSHKYNKLSINESKWNNIQNLRTENNDLVLEDIRFNDYKLIIDEKSGTIYYSVVNDSKNKYNPKVEYGTNESAKLAFLSDEITDEKIKSNYQFKVMIYNENKYHIYNLKCTEFPILDISYDNDEKISQKTIPMQIYLFDNLTNIPNKITISSGRVKGNEDELIFSLHMLTPGKNRRDNKISILNMKPNSEYKLTKVDNLQLQENNKNIENRKHRVELFLNGEYRGGYYLYFYTK